MDGSRLGTIAQVYTDAETGEQMWLAVAVGIGGTTVKYIPARGAGPRGVKDVIAPWDKPSIAQAPEWLPGSVEEEEEEEPEAEAVAEEPRPAPAAAVKPKARRRSGTNLTEIEGLGPDDADVLVAAGVRTIDALLESGGTAAGRRALARQTGVDAGTILEWVNRADLMRINGVGAEFSDLLESAGVDTVKELARRKPVNLQAKLEEINDAEQLVRRAPSLREVERWVEEAKSLPVAVTY